MTICQGWLAVCLATLSACVLVAAPPQEDVTPAMQLWQRGQEAMLAENMDKAVALYQASIQLEPKLARNFLSLAAAYMEKGNDEAAASSLERYLQLQPEHFLARSHLAELLLRLNKLSAAREHWEQFIADIQDLHDVAGDHLVHSHRRLMEIAEAEADEYAVHLHRGIGLYWLARQRQRLGNVRSNLDVEGLFCQAAGELSVARSCRPEEARASWYLFEIWSQLAQSQPAGCSLCAAEAAAPHSELTPWERRGLDIAWRQRGQQVSRK